MNETRQEQLLDLFRSAEWEWIQLEDIQDGDTIGAVYPDRKGTNAQATINTAQAVPGHARGLLKIGAGFFVTDGTDGQGWSFYRAPALPTIHTAGTKAIIEYVYDNGDVQRCTAEATGDGHWVCEHDGYYAVTALRDVTVTSTPDQIAEDGERHD